MSDIDPTIDSAFFDPPVRQNGPRPLLRFYTEAVHLPGKSVEAGRPIYEDRDFVGIINPGSKDEVVRLATAKAAEDEYVAWGYNRWKATKQQPVDGTPIDTVPFLSQSQVKELQGINVMSLEQLAELPDTAAQRMMGALDLRKKAKTYLQSAKDTAVVSKLTHELEQRDKQLAMLQQQMKDMSDRFDEMQKKVTA